MGSIEIWENVGIFRGFDFTGYYEVSTFGNIRSLDRNIFYTDGRIRKVKGKIVAQKENGETGYMQATLCKNGHTYTVAIHQLVALRFVPNLDPKNKTQVNHKDENRKNNYVNNLEWVTPNENANYGTRNQKLSKIKKECFRPILEFDLNGNFIKEYDSADDFPSKGARSSVVYAIKSNRYICYKHIWIRKAQYDSMNESEFSSFVAEKIKQHKFRLTEGRKKREIAVVQLTLDGEFIRIYESIKDAADKMGVDPSWLAKCTKPTGKTYGGFNWVRLEDYQSFSQSFKRD